MSPPVTRIIRSRRVATSDGIRPAAVHIAAGVIEAVTGFDQVSPGAELIEAGTALVFPGLVDSHVHINEPGRTEWEGFASATAAAAAGGITTLVDMPLNSIPATTSASALEEKRAAASGNCRVDTGFLGGVVPGNTAELPKLHEAGVLGFKCFLAPSGVDEFPAVDRGDLHAALPCLAELSALLMVHAELPAGLKPPTGDPSRYATWLASRPEDAEIEAVELLVELAQRYGVRVHVVHVSAPRTVEVIRRAQQAGTSVTGETCPHYLRFAADDIPDGAVVYKCAPPIRDAACREGLWVALENGGLDLVVSDHSPAPPAVKEPRPGDFLRAWGGIAALQLRLPLMWTMARNRGHEPGRLVEWLCTAPARLVGLDQRKGTLAPGRDADLVLWHPERVFTVTPELLKQRHPMTPWMGHRLAGEVEATYLRGEPVFSMTGPPRPPSGRLLSRSD